MSDAVRISAREIRPRVKSADAMLVCAYDSDEKFQNYHLEGAVSLSEFRTLVPTLAKDKELVFYCAWPNEGSAAGLADKYNKEGFTDTKALKGGPAGWKEAGFPVSWWI